MGINDAREQLEVCKDEYGKLERENAELRQALAELQPAEVLVEGSYFPVGDLPEVLGNFMRASDEYARDAKAAWAQVAELQAVIERVRKHLETARVPVTAIRAISEVENILSTSGTEALQAVKAATWNEAADAIAEQGTIQIPANPYRTEPR